MERELRQNRFDILPITPHQVEYLTHLPFHHRDPFDRLIIAQALAEKIPLISQDQIFDHYPISRIG